MIVICWGVNGRGDRGPPTQAADSGRDTATPRSPGRAQLDIEIKDRFGNPVRPREWFLVPLAAVDEAVSRIKDGTITQYVYDPTVARLTVKPSSRS